MGSETCEAAVSSNHKGSSHMARFLHDAKTIHRLIQYICESASEVGWKWETDRLRLLALDAADVTAVQACAERLDVYECSEADGFYVATQIAPFSRLLRNASKDATLVVTLHKDEIVVQLDQPHGETTLRLPTFIPEFPFFWIDVLPSASFVVETKLFHRLCKDFYSMDGVVTLKTEEQHFVMQNEKNTQRVKLLDQFSSSISPPQSEDFAARYVTRLTRSIASKYITVAFEKDQPLRFAFTIPDSHFVISAYLASIRR